jgi:hypothetical protein
MILSACVLMCGSAIFSGLIVATLTGNALVGCYAFAAISLGLTGIGTAILAGKRY